MADETPNSSEAAVTAAKAAVATVEATATSIWTKLANHAALITLVLALAAVGALKMLGVL